PGHMRVSSVPGGTGTCWFLGGVWVMMVVRRRVGWAGAALCGRGGRAERLPSCWTGPPRPPRGGGGWRRGGAGWAGGWGWGGGAGLGRRGRRGGGAGGGWGCGLARGAG